VEFRNSTDLTFVDISSESWREYRFADGQTVRIEQPVKLNVSPDNGHRLFDAAGVSHYIPPSWIHLRWQAKEGAPNFVL
jgi:hypothetical protein